VDADASVAALDEDERADAERAEDDEGDEREQRAADGLVALGREGRERAVERVAHRALERLVVRRGLGLLEHGLERRAAVEAVVRLGLEALGHDRVEL